MEAKKLLILFAVFLAVSGIIFANGEKEYPSQNINVVVQYSAGGGTDLSVRGVLEAAKRSLPSGVSFAVSNVTGGAGLIGLNQVVTSPSDGYTLGVVNTDLVINYCLGRTKISVNDFEPIACALIDPFVLIVSAKAPYKNFKEFIEYAKTHPGEIIMGDTGIGAAPSLAVLALEQFFGIKFKTISYGGSADCITAIAGGHINATIAQSVNAAAQVQAGNLLFLASLSEKRLATYPDIPTMKDFYPDIDFFMPGFCIISVKSDVDAARIKYLRSVIRPALDSSTYQTALKMMGMQTSNLDEAQTKAFLDEQLKLYMKLCKNISVK